MAKDQLHPSGIAKDSDTLQTQPDLPMKSPPRVYTKDNNIDDPYKFDKDGNPIKVKKKSKLQKMYPSNDKDDSESKSVEEKGQQ